MKQTAKYALYFSSIVILGVIIPVFGFGYIIENYSLNVFIPVFVFWLIIFLIVGYIVFVREMKKFETIVI